MTAKAKTCQICSAGHSYVDCPAPLVGPRSPRKRRETVATYHKRLRQNEYMRLWQARKDAEDPERKTRRNTYMRERIAKPGPAREKAMKRGRRAADRAKEALDARKVAPCMDCGRTFPPECMEFDHRPGETKLFNVGVYKRISSAKLDAEIAKCDLVCANCHRIRTTRRRRAKMKPRE